MIQAVIAATVSTVLADWTKSYALPIVRRRLARPTRNGSAPALRRNASPAPRTAAFVRTLER